MGLLHLPPLVHLRTGTLDPVHRTFHRHDGTRHRLTRNEGHLLEALGRDLDQDVSRDRLLAEVWGHRPTSLSRAVDHAVKRLRRKLGADALLTVHGVGYRLVGATRWLDLGCATVDLDTGRFRQRQAKPLTTQQRVLLCLLARGRGAPIPPDVIARRLGIPASGRRAVITAVHRLRRALGPSVPVEWVGGQGYRLCTSGTRGHHPARGAQVHAVRGGVGRQRVGE